MPQDGSYTLDVFAANGVNVLHHNGIGHKGINTFRFNTDNLASGVYVYLLQSQDYSEAKKMVLMK